MPIEVEHWMMFGTFAEQRHFVYPSKDTYHGVIINGNMAAHAPAGLGAFLLEKTDSLNYIIDPLTHAFQHDPDFISGSDGEPKTSIRAIADHYGPPVSDTIGKRPLLPRDFNDESVLSDFVENCLKFQKSILSEVMTDSDAMKYLLEANTNEPYALVAPYFYMTETSIDQWLPVCVRAAKRAIELMPTDKIFTSIVVNQGVILDPAKREKIKQAFADVNVAGFLLWADSFDEQTASQFELKGLLALSRDLRRNGEREVINLHGGYFSVLAGGVLGNNAVSGVTHGPEFGEHRSVVPVGGGIPIARYYIPQLHSRIRYRDALRFLGTKKWLESPEAFFTNVCDCTECKATIGDNIANFTSFGLGTTKEVRRGRSLVRIDFPTSETKQHCLRHYLNRKRLEYQFSSSASAEQIIEELHRGRSEFESVIGMDGVAHLERWENVLVSRR